MSGILEVAVTGGIGSGKTTICRIFEVLGVPVFYSDKEAKRLMSTDQVLKTKIRSAFGDLVYDEKGDLDRAYLAAQVFENDEQLQRLNGLVHPATVKAYEDWVRHQRTTYVIKEAAILFESGTNKSSDVVVLVTASETTRIQRVTKRDQVSEGQVRARMKKQWSDERKKALADYLIHNDETEAVIPQILRLHEDFLKR